MAMSLAASAAMAQQAGAGKPQRKSSETRDPVVPARGAVTDVWVVFKTHRMNVSKMTPVNLRGEPTGKSERIWFGRFSVELKAFAPASFVLE
jgi:hypothetical protein